MLDVVYVLTTRCGWMMQSQKAAPDRAGYVVWVRR